MAVTVRPHADAIPASADARWLAILCMARMGFSFIFTTYSAALPLLRTDWEMSASQAGMIQSAWHFGTIVSLFTVGFLCDRFGAKRIFLWSAVAASISGLVFAFFASGFVSGIILHGIAGLFAGGSYTPGLTLIAERFSSGTRGRAMGFYLGAGSVAHALSIIASSLLFPVGGWRLAFIVTCSMPTVGLALSIVALRHTPNLVHSTPQGIAILRPIAEVLKNKPALLSMLAYTFHCWELLGMWAWLPAYLAASALAGSGPSSGMLGMGVLLSGLTYLISMFGSLLGGGMSDRLGRSLTILLFSCISLSFSFTFGWMMSFPLWLLFAAAALYNLTSIADSAIYSTALTELVEPRYLGAAYAVRSVMGFGAGTISPWVFGLVLDLVRGGSHSEHLAWGLAWTSLGVGALAGPVMTLILRNRPEAARMARGRR